MPGPIIHLGVCLVALLLYFDDRHRKYILLLLPLAVLPDLDHFAPFYAPRIYFHNIFILVLPLAIALYGWKTKWHLVFDVGLMAGFCLLSHLVLDFFVGGGEASSTRLQRQSSAFYTGQSSSTGRNSTMRY